MQNEIFNLNKNIVLNLKKFFILSFFIYSVYCALKIGIHWDIFTHFESGNNKLKYFFSLGSIDKEADTPYLFHRITPGLSFTITAFMANIFPARYQVEILHLSNLAISFLGIYGLGKFVSLLFNKNISLIFLIILCTYGVFFGHLAVNPKDTVVATAYSWALYLILKYIKKQDGVSQKKIIYYLGFFLALGSGVRLLFVTTLAPVFLWLIFEIFFFKKIINNKFLIKTFILDVIKTFIVFYFILLIFWTHAHSNIFIKPFEILLETFKPMDAVGAAYGLLNGNVYTNINPIKSYVIINLFFKLPEYILLLYGFSIFVFVKYNYFFLLKFKDFNYKLFFILTILIGTNLLFFISPYPMYDGMRLFLFFIPIIFIIPSLILFFLFSNLRYTTPKIMLGFLIPLIFLYSYNFFSLTPFNYIYLNNFVKNPEIKFENDYLGLSLNELFEKSNFINKRNTRISFCGVGGGQIKYYLKKFNYTKILVVQHNENPDYIIMSNRVNWSGPDNGRTTCMNSYKGKILSSVSRNNIILTAVKEN